MTRTILLLSGVMTLALITLPPEAASAEDGETLYKTYCLTCHGEKGKGDGPASAALDPKPADFSDAKFWATHDDAAVKKVIKEGGAAVGKSPLMIAWGSVLNDAQVDAVIKHIKTFKGK